MKIGDRTRRPGRRWSGLALVIGVVFAGSLVSAIVYDAERRNESRNASELMDRYADEVTAAISDRVTRYGEALTDLSAALGAQSDLRSEDFTRAGMGLGPARLPGASGVTFVVPATSTQTAELQGHWRAHGSTALSLVASPQFGNHFYVVLDRVFDGGSTVLGIDLAPSEPVMTAMNLARQSEQLAIGPTYQLIRDRNIAPRLRQNSVAMAVPVRAAHDKFIGWLVMGVRGQDFLSQTLLDRGQGAVQVSLADPSGGGKVIAAATPGQRVTDADLTRERGVIVGQRRWDVTMWPTKGLLSTTDRGLSELTGVAGLALTAMLAIVTGVLAGSRNRAFQRVEQATAALRRDIQRREEVEAQLHHLAFHDPLTGLANRKLFYERLAHAIDTHTRGEATVAVLFIDLDGFKQVNDDRGHQAGDLVLTAVAERLVAGLRLGDTVARFGGDEFAAVLESLTGIDDAQIAAERVIADIRQPIDITGVPAVVSASVGIAVHHPGATADDLIRDADAAMYAAKAAGKNRYLMAGADPS
ncbi:sensor domain-containing diguanylate cyclase [Actinoplanes sp. NPDC026619]|uniref:sensor domain-containing diguanylate cyclase n=1 Tax=Actinoplanes sp. NPDC026619 TaxID=3155798 RepID=UPI00340A3218